ncbi:MAG: D-tyrosyl-tRNA(Tyr) deacylase [Verrucomicrobia bacterium]|nr:D-tyrosyl-tRNA(Tyr) deacylase [Verrucomicrobiota bacterium]
MRAVIQRVSSAQVTVAGEIVGRIGPGLLVLVGVQLGDTEEDGRWLAEKIAALRIFEDAAGKMNLPVTELPDDPAAVARAPRILAVSQFTLIANTRKGNRPSFNDAAKPDLAIPLYESFVGHLAHATDRPVETGRFGAMMAVSLVNDGPVTLVIDSRLRE